MKNILRALLLLPLLHMVPAAGEVLDMGFIREEPFRKQKQTVDLSSIGSAADLAVVRDAINPVMRLLVALNYARFPESVRREVMTDHGRQVLQLPPLRNKNNRYLIVEVNNWRVCAADRLAFTAVYGESRTSKDTWTRRFVFTKTGGAWRFHAHGEVHDNASCG